MRITLISYLMVLFSVSCFSQAQTPVIKEINYAYDKVGVIPVRSSHKNIFVYGNDKNKVQVYDLKKDSGQTAFDTVMKYSIVYDTVKNQVTQTAYVKKSPGGWKKQAEIITSYNKDKSISDIQWRTIKKDKMVPYGKFTYSNDSLKRPREIKYDVADSTGKFNPNSKLLYDYDRKGLKTNSLMSMQDGKWVNLSKYIVNFDSSNVIVSLLKFKTGNRLDNRYSLENSYSLEKQQRTLTFRDNHPETSEFAGKPQTSNYVTINYNDSIVKEITGYIKNAKGTTWIQAVAVKYSYGNAPHPLNNVLKNYLKFDALKVRFDDFINENYISDVNGIIDNSKLFGQEKKRVMFGMDGVMLRYFAE